jgi:hypothetical protein
LRGGGRLAVQFPIACYDLDLIHCHSICVCCNEREYSFSAEARAENDVGVT